jgi:hypothetical protein
MENIVDSLMGKSWRYGRTIPLIGPYLMALLTAEFSAYVAYDHNSLLARHDRQICALAVQA